MILICSSLVISHVEYLFTYLFSICIGKLHLDFFHPEVMRVLSDTLVSSADGRDKGERATGLFLLIFGNQLQCNWTLCGLRDMPWECWRPSVRTRKT